MSLSQQLREPLPLAKPRGFVLKSGTARIVAGDALTVLQQLPSKTFHCCITSPPYYGLRDYGVVGQLGLEATPDKYIANMVAVFREVRRVLRTDGTCWVNIGDSYNAGTSAKRKAPKTTIDVGGWQDSEIDGGARIDYPGLAPKQLLMMPARVALALQSDGWWLRSDIIWHKPNPMPESVTDRPTNAHEHVFLLTKAPRYFYDAEAIKETADMKPQRRGVITGKHNLDRQDGGMPLTRAVRDFPTVDGNGSRNARDVWTIATEAFPGAHFATFPPELAERCIKAGTSERGCCAKCGAPWVRIVSKGEPDWEHRAASGADSTGGYNGQSTKGHDAAGVQNASDVKRRILEGMRHKTFVWSPSCKCEADTAPCQVLDPFGGSGTTGLVAGLLGRHTTLIELSNTYAAMAQKRLMAAHLPVQMLKE